MPRTWLWVASTALATLALRELYGSSSSAETTSSSSPPAPAARSHEVDDLRRAVTGLRTEVARIPIVHVAPAAPEREPLDPQARSEIIARAQTRVSAAIARGVWTPADDVAVLGGLGPLSDEDRIAVMFEVHHAITSGQMRPAPMITTQGDAR